MPRVMKQQDIDNAIAKAQINAVDAVAQAAGLPPLDPPEKPKKARKPRKMMLGEFALLEPDTDMGPFTICHLGTSDPAKVKAAIRAASLTDGVQYQLIRLGYVFTAKRVTIEKTEIVYQ